MLRHLALAVLLIIPVTHAQTSQRFSVPPDSPRWDLEGRAQVAEFQGRKAILLDGGAAVLKDFEMRDGTIVDVATTATIRGFMGINELLLAIIEIGGWPSSAG